MFSDEEVIDMARRHQRRFSRLGCRVVDGPGQLDTELRRAAFRRDVDALPQELRTYIGKVHDHAYRVSDGDIEGLVAAGYTEDQIFEMTVAAAAGAGLGRLERARQAMSEA